MLNKVVGALLDELAREMAKPEDVRAWRRRTSVPTARRRAGGSGAARGLRTIERPPVARGAGSSVAAKQELDLERVLGSRRSVDGSVLVRPAESGATSPRRSRSSGPIPRIASRPDEATSAAVPTLPPGCRGPAIAQTACRCTFSARSISPRRRLGMCAVTAAVGHAAVLHYALVTTIDAGEEPRAFCASCFDAGSGRSAHDLPPGDLPAGRPQFATTGCDNPAPATPVRMWPWRLVAIELMPDADAFHYQRADRVLERTMRATGTRVPREQISSEPARARLRPSSAWPDLGIFRARQRSEPTALLPRANRAFPWTARGVELVAGSMLRARAASAAFAKFGRKIRDAASAQGAAPRRDAGHPEAAPSGLSRFVNEMLAADVGVEHRMACCGRRVPRKTRAQTRGRDRRSSP